VGERYAPREAVKGSPQNRLILCLGGANCKQAAALPPSAGCPKGESSVSKDVSEPPALDERDRRLSSIETTWTLLFQAHQAQAGTREEAQKKLLLRYYGAAYRYLVGTVHDPLAAEELAQEFAVRFLRGDFRNADPGRGRFRDFLKTALRHLAMDFWRQNAKAPRALATDQALLLPSGARDLDALDREFLDNWREELISRTWGELEAVQARTGQPYYSVLRHKTQEPQVRSAQLAEDLHRQFKKSFSAAATRQILHRARELFADLLVEEILQSLETIDLDKAEQELIELNLLSYCTRALERRKKKGTSCA
jgi:DNA-directed RNA polymerase specialized sigma24 family protein